MHGLIVNQLRNYTVARHGNDVWTTALERSGAPLPAGTPSLGETYPDAVVVGVIVEVASVAKQDVQDLLRDFGEYLAGGLLRVYEPLVRPEWKTLDVVEHVEQQIHTVVRLRDPKAGPPYLTARRVSPTEVDVVYGSERHLCSLAEGIVRGLATHYHEQVSIRQPECMLRGDVRCLIKVKLVKEATRVN